MSKFKVGDRVSAFTGTEIGTVVYVSVFSILVKLDAWGGGHAGGSYYKNSSLEYDKEACNHWWFTDYELVLVAESNE